jgi:NIMA (never in mitosis gene a)-related kinase
MVALRPPFQATNHLALAKKIIQGTTERIPHRYSEDLQNVINWMLNKEPEKRPTVDELMGIPKIQLRMNERKMREDYAALKIRETAVHEKYDKLK